jgi:hypothetical protein
MTEKAGISIKPHLNARERSALKRAINLLETERSQHEAREGSTREGLSLAIGVISRFLDTAD